MVRVISLRYSTPTGLKLTKLFDIYDFSVAKDSGKVLIIIIYCFYNYYHSKDALTHRNLSSGYLFQRSVPPNFIGQAVETLFLILDH